MVGQPFHIPKGHVEGVTEWGPSGLLVISVLLNNQQLIKRWLAKLPDSPLRLA